MLTAPTTAPLIPPPSSEEELVMTPEPESTSGGSLEDQQQQQQQQHHHHPSRRRSQPVEGSPRDSILSLSAAAATAAAAITVAERRASEGSAKSLELLYRKKEGVEAENDDFEIKPTQGNADWTRDACSVAHIFIPTSSSSDSCYLNANCRRNSGPRSKCVACRIVVHDNCIPELKFDCKESFRECVRKYREQTSVSHHWVQRKHLKGKCKHCGKAFQSKLGLGNAVVGYSCSWCKYSYHNKDNCLRQKDSDTDCDLGALSPVIVPPSWIVKLPRKGSFKSSLKYSPSKKKVIGGTTSPTCEEGPRMNLIEESSPPNNNSTTTTTTPPVASSSSSTPSLSSFPFCIKPLPSPDISPILVFINPKSGGNQGAKLMQKFQWLLNPRQVFDLTQGGPGPAIEMFRNVPNCKLLACGGDGTVGWLLSVLDKVPADQHAAVGVLPLGTGNDLSRSLGWGGGYMDEPISKIIAGLQNANEIHMDRWQLRVTRNPIYPATEKGEDNLPLNVVNNYFSMGVDAQIALQFHEAREANPSKFNSRIRNKMFYGQAGGKDLLLRKWKDLSDEITVECDGKDVTPKLREHRVHSVLFANISSFCSGTRPWNRSSGEQRFDDGLIEVMGFTTYQLPLLQAGGHAICITQCKTAKITTRKTIPMQVDGEASRLNPATIELSFLNQVCMLSKKKGDYCKRGHDKKKELKLNVSKITMADYEVHHNDKDRIKELAQPFGEITTSPTADLEQVRALINKVMENNKPSLNGVVDWCFVDSITAIRFFRIDRAQENLHFVTDISGNDGLYILETDPNSAAANGDPHFSCAAAVAAVVADSIAPVTPTEKFAPTISNGGGGTGGGGGAGSGGGGGDQQVSSQEMKTTQGVLKAARLGDLHMLTDLYNENYSLMSVDETGKTALHYGARFGHKEIVRFLIAKAPPSILDMVDSEKGQTALHMAAGYKRRTICCMLVAAGSSLTIRDNDGKTSRQLALMVEDHDLSSYLESQEHFQAEKEDYETPV